MTATLTTMPAQQRRSADLFAWLIIALGLLVRLACVVFVTRRHVEYPDEGSYWTMAGRLLQGQGLSLPNSAFEGLIHANAPTGYFGAFAVFVAPLRLIFGDHIGLARAAMAILSWPALVLAIDGY